MFYLFQTVHSPTHISVGLSNIFVYLIHWKEYYIVRLWILAHGIRWHIFKVCYGVFTHYCMRYGKYCTPKEQAGMPLLSRFMFTLVCNVKLNHLSMSSFPTQGRYKEQKYLESMSNKSYTWNVHCLTCIWVHTQHSSAIPFDDWFVQKDLLIFDTCFNRVTLLHKCAYCNVLPIFCNIWKNANNSAMAQWSDNSDSHVMIID